MAQHLRELSGTKSKPLVAGRRSAIAYAHLEAGFENPCAAAPVTLLMRDIHPPGWSFASALLTSDKMKEIRRAALRRKPRGCGMESSLTAQRRGLVDIAICSLLHEAKFSARQMAGLKWRDVRYNGQGGAWLTVYDKADRGGGAQIRTIGEQATRDLDAIRPGGRPEDSVFGLCPRTCYRRVNAVFVAAGLGSPPSAGPSKPRHGGAGTNCPSGGARHAPPRSESDPPGSRCAFILGRAVPKAHPQSQRQEYPPIHRKHVPGDERRRIARQGKRPPARFPPAGRADSWDATLRTAAARPDPAAWQRSTGVSM